ncbi:hypothetical protein H1R20_g11726, partial [Candolleomyces eurysporus]
MVSFTSLFVAVSAALGALAVPTGTNLTTRAGTPSSEGTHDGFFYSWWTDNGATATYTNGPKGQYTISWGTGGNLVGGKGWNPGSTTRVMTYTGSYQYNGNSYLAVYGWTRSPLIEYYIVENFGSYNPSSAASNKGTVTVDGAVYDMGVSTRTNQPSIDGTATFQQFWSVRRNKRSSGTVDIGAHFRAWEAAGMRLGSNHYYQILACEGYHSSGSCNMTVSEGGSGNPPAGTTTTTTTSAPTATNPPPTTNCAAKWQQCGGQGFSGPSCCESGSTCTVNNQWYSQCI